MKPTSSSRRRTGGLVVAILLGSLLAMLHESLVLASSFNPSSSLAVLEAKTGLAGHWKKIRERSHQGATGRIEARDEALRVAHLLRKRGDEQLWAAFTELALRIAAERGQWNFVEAKIWPDREALLLHAEVEIIDKAALNLMDYAGFSNLRSAQADLAKGYTTRIATRMGEGSPAHVQSRIHAGESFLLTRDRVNGVRLLQDAVNAASGLRDQPGATISFHQRVAEVFWKQGLGNEAEAVFLQALNSDAAQISTPELGNLWASRSSFLEVTDRIGPAILAAKTANMLLREHYGESSESLVVAADRLATLLSRNGAAASGLSIAKLNHDRAWKHLGNIPLSWRTTNNYAEALRMIGRPDLAAPLDDWLLKKRIDHYGLGSIQALVSASNAALDRIAMGEYEGARTFLKRQREAAAALADPSSEHVAQADAWLVYVEALHAGRINDKALLKLEKFKNWAGSPEILSIRATTLAARERGLRGETTVALALLTEAEKISAQSFAKSHPETFAVRLERTRVLSRGSDLETAIRAFADLESDLFEWMLGEVGTAGNRTVAAATRVLADDVLLAFANFALKAPSAVPAFSNASMRWKTLTSTDTMRLQTVAGRLDDEHAAVVQEVLHLRALLNERLSSGNVDEAANEVSKRLEVAERALTAHRKADPNLHEELARQLPTIESVLEPGDAMIDYVEIVARGRTVASTLTAQARAGKRLLAIVRRNEKAPVLVDLGSPDIAAGTVAIASTLTGEDSRLSQVALRSARTLLIEPLASLIEESKRLFIVPSASLYALPWSALSDEAERSLSSMKVLRILTRADALYRVGLEDRMDKGETALLVGDVSFASRARPLPGTAREVSAIADRLSRASIKKRIISGDAATEPTVKFAVEGKSVVHMATHGFFRPQTVPSTNTDAPTQSAPSQQKLLQSGFVISNDPLWRGGILLARGGDPNETLKLEKDGVAYAREIMEWRLADAELVVLSACETGLGSPDAVEALRGIPSALRIAGARRSLVTLWPVDDKGAANFMIRFYEHVASGLSYAEALDQTRNAAMNGKIEAARKASLWAAFVLLQN